MNLSRNGFVKIKLYVIFGCSHLINLVGFQLDMDQNWIWTDSLNTLCCTCWEISTWIWQVLQITRHKSLSNAYISSKLVSNNDDMMDYIQFSALSEFYMRIKNGKNVQENRISPKFIQEQTIINYMFKKLQKETNGK